MQNIITTLLILTCLSCFGQKVERVVVAHEDPYDLYANFDKDSATLFYEKIVPKSKPIGVLVILPGSGERLEDVRKQITLHSLAVQQNLLVIFPSINWGTNKHVPEHQLLDAIFRQVVKQYEVPKDKFVIGGFSGGGMVALTYTEKANKYTDSTFIKPKAVFGVDPPLDYAHLWKHCEKDIERNVSEAAVMESKWIIDMYTKEFGGSPDAFRENYIKYSIFSYGEKDGGNAKYLKTTPVLLYTEPDIMWQMQNRQRDYYDLNCVDIAAMINFLQIRGNKNAKLVVTENKGRRLDGMRHPHSWSIMDSNQCLSWIMEQLGK
jgi:acetyl esterase/lipase